MSVTETETETLSDALFTCIYLWVNGHPVDKKAAREAASRHCDKHSCYGRLAQKMKDFVPGSGMSYEALCEAGFCQTDAKKQRQTRMNLIAGYTGGEAVKALLCDSERINRLFPAGKEQPAAPRQAGLSLSQMGPSQRGGVLLEHYSGKLALDADSDVVHHYNGIVWQPLSDRALARQMAAIFIDSETAYSMPAMKNAVDAMKLSLPVMGAPSRHLVGFRNGVFDTRQGIFRPHDPGDWLLIASDVTFTAAVQNETLAGHAPVFQQWLNGCAGHHPRKADRILAALYMVMANRYDWQLFLEVTGAGGSGKSVMAEICTMLAGKGNTVSASMAALENPRERALIVGYSLIIMPDMTRYAGDGAGIKAITGGDKVAIDPKHKPPYSTRIPAVILAVNNNAMTFSDRSGGISRRRVIFNFSRVIPEDERDPLMTAKIEAELPVIIRHLLTRFTDQQEARQLLSEQQTSEEALAIKRECDSLVDFCGYLTASPQCDGMFIGNAEIVPFSPRRYLYHAYMAYMRANALSKPVSLTRFGTDMPGAMAEYGKAYLRRKSTKGHMRSNLTLSQDAEAWLPFAAGEQEK